jgi:hypothetical protein
MWPSTIPDVGAPLQGESSVSSQPFVMAFTHQQTVSHEEACVPKPSFNNLQQSREILPNKMLNFINVLMLIHEELPHSLS